MTGRHPRRPPPKALLEAATVPGLEELRAELRAIRSNAAPPSRHRLREIQALMSKRLRALELTLLDHSDVVDIETVCECALLNSEHISRSIGGVRVQHAEPDSALSCDVGRFTSLLSVLISEMSNELFREAHTSGLELKSAQRQSTLVVSVRSLVACRHQNVLKRVPPRSLGDFDLKVIERGFELLA